MITISQGMVRTCTGVSRRDFLRVGGVGLGSLGLSLADLNALNAALAVIKWKKLFGFYLDLKSEYHSQFHTATNLLVNEDRPE